tara:strand:+ start:3290 stop:4882 length:1593 start_codon:yes stop_codon:yes gene_type:complete
MADTKKQFTPNITEQELSESSYTGNPVRDFIRSFFGQGVGMGFGDEIEAGLKNVFSNKSYDEIISEVRTEINEYKKEFPITATTSEIAGSIAPIIVATVFSGGTATGPAIGGKATQFIAKNPVKTGIGQGTIYGAGVSEGGAIDRLPSAGISGGISGVTGGVSKLLGPTVTPTSRDLINKGANLTPGQAMSEGSLIGEGLKLGEEVLESLPLVGTRAGLTRGTEGFNKVVVGEIADIIKFDKSKFKNLNMTDTFVMLDDAVNDFYKKSANKLKLNKNIKLKDLKKNMQDVVKNSDLTESEKLKAYARLQKFIEVKAPTPSKLHEIDKSLSNRVFKGMKSADPDQREIAIVLGEAKKLFDDALVETNDYIVAKDAYGKMRILGGASQGDDVFSPQKLKQSIKKGDASRNKTKLARGEARLQDTLRAGQESVQKKLGSSGTAERLLPYLAVGGATATIDPSVALAVAGYGGAIGNPYTNIAVREGLSGASNLLTRSSPFIGSRVGQDMLSSENRKKMEEQSRLEYLNSLLNQ